MTRRIIEGVFAEGKQWHGLGRAWRRGLSKMRVQCALIAAFKAILEAVGLNNHKAMPTDKYVIVDEC